MKSKLLPATTDFTVFDGLIQGSGVKVLAMKPGLEHGHLGSQQHSYPLFRSFHFYDFGCQVETSRYFRALVNLPKTPPVDTKQKMGNQLNTAHCRNFSYNYSYRRLKIAQYKVNRIRCPAA